MTHGRHRILKHCGSLLLLPAVTGGAGQGEVALRAAMETETVKGDLKGRHRAVQGHRRRARSRARREGADADGRVLSEARRRRSPEDL